MKRLFFSLAVVFALIASAPVKNGYEVGDLASDFKLKNVDGKMVSMADWKDAKGFIVIFDCNTCPYSKAYNDRIKISGRTKHFINAFGEEVIIENAEAAITRACEMTEGVINNFTAAPIYLEKNKRGGHEWIIEFHKEPKNLEEFGRILDETLRRINSDYDAKRFHDMALIAPKIHSVPDGTFYNWMKRRGKLGGQNKVPRLSNSREFIDDILATLPL